MREKKYFHSAFIWKQTFRFMENVLRYKITTKTHFHAIFNKLVIIYYRGLSRKGNKMEHVFKLFSSMCVRMFDMNAKEKMKSIWKFNDLVAWFFLFFFCHFFYTLAEFLHASSINSRIIRIHFVVFLLFLIPFGFCNSQYKSIGFHVPNDYQKSMNRQR